MFGIPWLWLLSFHIYQCQIVDHIERRKSITGLRHDEKVFGRARLYQDKGQGDVGSEYPVPTSMYSYRSKSDQTPAIYHTFKPTIVKATNFEIEKISSYDPISVQDTKNHTSQSTPTFRVDQSLVTLNWGDLSKLPTYVQFCAAVDAYSFTRAGGHPPKPSQEVYYYYKDIVARNMALKEQAMLMANVVWESGGLQFMEEITCRAGDCIYGTYFGRGYIQLTWDYNYRDASYGIYGDDRLVRYPAKVAEVVDAWKTTLWYWRTYVTPKLIENDAIDNFLLGYAIMAINGRLECKPKTNAKERLRIYNAILSAWDLNHNNIGKMTGCLEDYDHSKELQLESSSLDITTTTTSQMERHINAINLYLEPATPTPTILLTSQ